MEKSNQKTLPISGSFRDPAGRVYRRDGGVYRSVTRHGASAFSILKDSNFVQDLVDSNLLVRFSIEPKDDLRDANNSEDIIAVLDLEPLEFVSYPYEWTFSALKRAALCHLDIQLRALHHDISLVDASAYNIQFNGPHPIFIDHLSFRPYEDGMPWIAHQQFCEHFLNPLLLQSALGIPFNAWYRGSPEGISTECLAPLLPTRSRLSVRTMMHVIVPNFVERRLRRRPRDSSGEKTVKLPKSAFRSMLLGLRKWIASLEPRTIGATRWGTYDSNNPYSSEEESAKRGFVAAYAAEVEPRLLWDLGCNTGDYAAVMLANGTSKVIGFDSDAHALERAFQRSSDHGLDLLPLYQDLANPSADLGWNQRERFGLEARRNADGVLALALLHHLVIGHNVPMNDALAWIVGSAPTGIIEFAPKSDPMVSRMLRWREDIFLDYSEEVFLACLSALAAIVETRRISTGGRLLVRYSKRTD